MVRQPAISIHSDRILQLLEPEDLGEPTERFLLIAHKDGDGLNLVIIILSFHCVSALERYRSAHLVSAVGFLAPPMRQRFTKRSGRSA